MDYLARSLARWTVVFGIGAASLATTGIIGCVAVFQEIGDNSDDPAIADYLGAMGIAAAPFFIAAAVMAVGYFLASTAEVWIAARTDAPPPRPARPVYRPES